MSVRVAVRCRPFNQRERTEPGCRCVVNMQDRTTTLLANGGDAEPRQFTFDHSFWSHNAEDAHFVGQEQVFASIGSEVLKDVFDGYNVCLFAYGQTGSGKSYTMMGGAGEERGIIPRLCEGLFSRIKEQSSDSWNATVEVSYLEIYLEKVRDLLSTDDQHKLRVREHATLGPYVEGLSLHAVENFESVNALMDEGNRVGD